MPRAPTHEEFQERVWEHIRTVRKMYDNPDHTFGWVVLNATYQCYPTYVSRHIGHELDPTWKSSKKVQEFIDKLEEEVCGARNIQQENPPER
jgi:hypothetical protein